MKKQLAIGGAIAVALAFAAAPAFAIAEGPAPTVRAESGDYAGDAPVDVSPAVITKCQQSSVLFGAGFFDSGETVGIGLSGSNAANANIPASVTAAGDGSAVVLFTPPAGGSGPYTLSFAAESASYQAVITVNSGSCGQGPENELPLTPGTTNPPTELPLTTSTNGASGPMELPLTGGGGLDPLLLGIGGGAIVLGASLAIVGATRGRRNKA